MQRAFCYLPEHQIHHLDHLVPLAIELNLPVISHCERQRDLAERFYPQANFLWTPPNAPLELREKSIVISTLPINQLRLALFLESQLYGPFKSVFCPHGLSDKELLSSQFQELNADSKVLLYGEKMKREIPSLCKPFYIGNYRKYHFEAFKELYLGKLNDQIKSSCDRWTLLWAPTWIDRVSQNKTLASILEHSLLSFIPEEIEIIFKPHPNLFRQIPRTLAKIKEASEKVANLHFLEEVPYIYPLFEYVDAYLGDTSSIGYDFMTTLKPCFSITKNLASPWQKIALEAPIKEGAIDWEKLRDGALDWDIIKSQELLEVSFAKIGPLSGQREAFYQYLEEKDHD